MTQSRLLLDISGGDQAPKSILDGALRALPRLKHPLVLIGNESVIRKHKISKHLGTQVFIEPAEGNIEMHDNIRAVRSKPNASINVGTRLAAESWKAFLETKRPPDIFISAGHTGAVMTSALLTMGRLKGVERPAIASRLPTLNGKGFVMLDLGANTECKPEHFRDFAIMGSVLAQSLQPELKKPKIAILSNGEESSKGTPLTRDALNLIQNSPQFSGLNSLGEFVGYCEGKEMFLGDVDVVVTDGFTGNLILKSSEGLGSALFSLIKNQMKFNPLNFLGMMIASPAMLKIKKQFDYRETGGAPLLGVAGSVLICHGRSDALAIDNALMRAQESLEHQMTEKLSAAFAIGGTP